MSESPSTLQVLPVACLKDNYAYLVFKNDGDGSCIVVDPGDANPVLHGLRKHGLSPRAIFNTHHHWDHVTGNEKLLEEYPDLLVVAHESDEGRVPGQNVSLRDRQELVVAGIPVVARHVPGHTSGALAYLVHDRCFTGDTLFCGGCGRMFEGTPDQMNRSLTQVLAQLPAGTQLYCGHEYTEANLTFAAGVFPTDEIMARLDRVKQMRRDGAYCASSTVAVEKETNLFLMTSRADLQAHLGTDGDPVSTFAALRKLKDQF